MTDTVDFASAKPLKATGTRHVHEYLPSGCRNQWAWDHDDAECIANMP